MIDTVKELFDYVIIDTPPIGLVIDSAIIAQKADASILVTEAGAIKRRFIQKQTNGTKWGFVLGCYFK